MAGRWGRVGGGGEGREKIRNWTANRRTSVKGRGKRGRGWQGRRGRGWQGGEGEGGREGGGMGAMQRQEQSNAKL